MCKSLKRMVLIGTAFLIGGGYLLLHPSVVYASKPNFAVMSRTSGLSEDADGGFVMQRRYIGVKVCQDGLAIMDMKNGKIYFGDAMTALAGQLQAQNEIIIEFNLDGAYPGRFECAGVRF